MEPLRVYDYLTLTRFRIFQTVRTLREDQYMQEFPIGPGTIGRILTHIMISEWYYVQRIQGRDVPPYEEWPIKDETPPAFSVLERAWSEQATQTRQALTDIHNWESPLDYTVTQDDGHQVIVTASPRDQFTQLILHEIHHRAQALNILRRLGVDGPGDLDFNALMFGRKEA